jgi:hypothetical protein
MALRRRRTISPWLKCICFAAVPDELVLLRVPLGLRNTQRAHECVLELEESLLFSRRTLAESRKLLASTEELREKVR